MSTLFAYDALRLDSMLLRRIRDLRSAGAESLDEISEAPGLTASELLPDFAQGSAPITSHLHALAYWLFINLGDPVIRPPSHHAFIKCVRLVRIHSDDGLPGRACLSVIADGGTLNGPEILVTVPHVADILVGTADGRFADTRKALHEAAERWTERVNVVWPTALLLAAAAASD